MLFTLRCLFGIYVTLPRAPSKLPPIMLTDAPRQSFQSDDSSSSAVSSVIGAFSSEKLTRSL
jgi:hypothetical protein